MGNAEFNEATNEFIFIDDDRVPQARAKIGVDDVIEIIDEDVPLSGLPITGGMGVYGFLIVGFVAVVLGIVIRKKRN